MKERRKIRNILKTSCLSFTEDTKIAVRNMFVMTDRQLHEYLEVCLSKYLKAKIEPGKKKKYIKELL